jgi:hypothetical protein
MVQVKVKHQDEGMHRHAGEQPLGQTLVQGLDLVLGVIAIALGGLAEIGRQHLAGGIERERPRREDALVVHQPRAAAAR